MTAKFSSSDSLLPDGQALLFFVMRCLMYAHSYNDYQMARDAFARLPPGTRSRLGQTYFFGGRTPVPPTYGDHGPHAAGRQRFGADRYLTGTGTRGVQGQDRASHRWRYP